MQLLPTFLAILFSFVMLNTEAQNTSPYWSLAGNSNASTSAKLGTTNLIPLNLATNNLTRLKIFENGRVGVGSHVTNANATRVLNLVDGNAVMRILRVHNSFAPAVELISRTTADGANVAYWDFYAEPSDKSFRIRDRVTGANLDRLTIANTGNVGIGTTSPTYKLEVEGGTATAIFATSTGSNGIMGNSTGTGVYGSGGYTGVEGYSPGGTGYGYGVLGHSSYTGVLGNGRSYGVSGYGGAFGVYGSASNSDGTAVFGIGYYGVRGVSNTLYGVHGTGYSVGVVGRGSTSHTYSYGVTGFGEYQGGYFTGKGYGVQGYASSSGGTGVYGSTSSGGYAGYFNGTVYATTYTGSDRKLKKNIEHMSTALDIINKLHPKIYEFRRDGSYQYMNLPEGKHYGLIAQELEPVLPALVKDTRFDTRVEREAQAKAASGGTPDTRNSSPSGEIIDFKAVNYTELIPIIIRSVQELDEKTEEIERLKSELADLKQLVNKLANGQNINPAANKAALLQNAPNPVKGTTSIQYSLPEGSSRGQLLLTDALGKTIKVIQLTSSGVVSVDVSTLSSGVYNYSLVVDGKTLQTRKMTVGR